MIVLTKRCELCPHVMQQESTLLPCVTRQTHPIFPCGSVPHPLHGFLPVTVLHPPPLHFLLSVPLFWSPESGQYRNASPSSRQGKSGPELPAFPLQSDAEVLKSLVLVHAFCRKLGHHTTVICSSFKYGIFIIFCR